MCVSFYHPQDVKAVEEISPFIMYDNGAFSEWQAAIKRGEPWFIREDWSPYYEWLEARIYHPGRWAVIPDAPGAPSQLNDSLLNGWPFGSSKGVPLWHMDGPIERLLRLCEKYDRVALGWVGEIDPMTGKIFKDQKAVDCPAYHKRMDDVAKALGNRWPPIHMMRGVKVAFKYPFDSADSTSLAQNGHRYDYEHEDKWHGRKAYADRLESPNRRRGSIQRKSSRSRGKSARAQLGGDCVVEGQAGCGRNAEASLQLSFAF